MRRDAPYTMLGTPSAHSKTKILSIKEVAQLMANNPKAREAVERISRFEGQPRLVEKVIHEAYYKNVTTVMNNKFQIDAAIRKKEGKLG